MTMGPGPMNQGPPLRPNGPMGQGPMMQNPNAGPMGNQMGQGPPMPMSSVMGGPPMQNMPVQMPVQGMPVQGMPVQGMPGVVPGNMPSNAMGRMQPRKVIIYYNLNMQNCNMICKNTKKFINKYHVAVKKIYSFENFKLYV